MQLTMYFGVVCLTLTYLLSILSKVSAEKIICDPGTGMDLFWRRDPEDCSTAFLCVFGRKVEFTCPVGYVISKSGRFCVPAGTDADDCSGVISLIWDRDFTCKVGESKPSETNCAEYLECVIQGKAMSGTMMKECPYPMLYDQETGKCGDYKTVKCTDGQFIPKSPCDYQVNQCTGAHCVPCNVIYPSCSGLSDGKHPWTGREWSPYYVMCDSERVTYQGQCEGEKEAEVFHPDRNECVMYEDKVVVG